MTDPDTAWSSAPAEPSIPRGEVQVWRIDLDHDAWPATDPMRFLAPDELLRASRFRFERDRRRFVTARAALRRILASYSGKPPDALRFSYGEQGKPALTASPGDPDLRFNLSHSRGVAVCGVAPGANVGIDVERVRPRVEIDAIARRFFSVRELQSYRSLDPGLRREAFFRCWTRKEAYLKATGRGVFGGSTRFDVTLGPDEAPRLLQVSDDPEEAERWTLLDLSPKEGFRGAVIVEGAAATLRRFVLAPGA